MSPNSNNTQLGPHTTLKPTCGSRLARRKRKKNKSKGGNKNCLTASLLRGDRKAWRKCFNSHKRLTTIKNGWIELMLNDKNLIKIPGKLPKPLKPKQNFLRFGVNTKNLSCSMFEVNKSEPADDWREQEGMGLSAFAYDSWCPDLTTAVDLTRIKQKLLAWRDGTLADKAKDFWKRDQLYAQLAKAGVSPTTQYAAYYGAEIDFHPEGKRIVNNQITQVMAEIQAEMSALMEEMNQGGAAPDQTTIKGLAFTPMTKPSNRDINHATANLFSAFTDLAMHTAVSNHDAKKAAKSEPQHKENKHGHVFACGCTAPTYGVVTMKSTSTCKCVNGTFECQYQSPDCPHHNKRQDFWNLNRVPKAISDAWDECQGMMIDEEIRSFARFNGQGILGRAVQLLRMVDEGFGSSARVQHHVEMGGEPDEEFDNVAEYSPDPCQCMTCGMPSDLVENEDLTCEYCGADLQLHIKRESFAEYEEAWANLLVSAHIGAQLEELGVMGFLDAFDENRDKTYRDRQIAEDVRTLRSYFSRNSYSILKAPSNGKQDILNDICPNALLKKTTMWSSQQPNVDSLRLGMLGFIKQFLGESVSIVYSKSLRQVMDMNAGNLAFELIPGMEVQGLCCMLIDPVDCVSTDQISEFATNNKMSWVISAQFHKEHSTGLSKLTPEIIKGEICLEQFGNSVMITSNASNLVTSKPNEAFTRAKETIMYQHPNGVYIRRLVKTTTIGVIQLMMPVKDLSTIEKLLSVEKGRYRNFNIPIIETGTPLETLTHTSLQTENVEVDLEFLETLLTRGITGIVSREDQQIYGKGVAHSKYTLKDRTIGNMHINDSKVITHAYIATVIAQRRVRHYQLSNLVFGATGWTGLGIKSAIAIANDGIEWLKKNTPFGDMLSDVWESASAKGHNFASDMLGNSLWCEIEEAIDNYAVIEAAIENMNSKPTSPYHITCDCIKGEGRLCVNCDFAKAEPNSSLCACCHCDCKHQSAAPGHMHEHPICACPKRVCPHCGKLGCHPCLVCPEDQDHQLTAMVAQAAQLTSKIGKTPNWIGKTQTITRKTPTQILEGKRQATVIKQGIMQKIDTLPTGPIIPGLGHQHTHTCAMCKMKYTESHPHKGNHDEWLGNCPHCGHNATKASELIEATVGRQSQPEAVVFGEPKRKPNVTQPGDTAKPTWAKTASAVVDGLETHEIEHGDVQGEISTLITEYGLPCMFALRAQESETERTFINYGMYNAKIRFVKPGTQVVKSAFKLQNVEMIPSKDDDCGLTTLSKVLERITNKESIQQHVGKSQLYSMLDMCDTLRHYKANAVIKYGENDTIIHEDESTEVFSFIMFEEPVTGNVGHWCRANLEIAHPGRIQFRLSSAIHESVYQRAALNSIGRRYDFTLCKFEDRVRVEFEALNSTMHASTKEEAPDPLATMDNLLPEDPRNKLLDKLQLSPTEYYNDGGFSQLTVRDQSDIHDAVMGDIKECIATIQSIRATVADELPDKLKATFRLVPCPITSNGKDAIVKVGHLKLKSGDYIKPANQKQWSTPLVKNGKVIYRMGEVKTRSGKIMMHVMRQSYASQCLKLKSLLKADLESLEGVKLKVAKADSKVGPPGYGKTYELIKKLDEEKDSWYLYNTGGSKNAAIRIIMEGTWATEPSELMNRIMSVEQARVNHPKGHLMFDEATMNTLVDVVIAGENATRLTLRGDYTQVGLIDVRTLGGEKELMSVLQYADNVAVENTTRRMGKTLVKLIRKHFDNLKDLQSIAEHDTEITAEFTRVLTYEAIHKGLTPSAIGLAHYTYTTTKMQAMLETNGMGNTCSNTHSFQGNESEGIVFIVDYTGPHVELYSNVQYNLSAISRAKTSLHIVIVGKECRSKSTQVEEAFELLSSSMGMHKVGGSRPEITLQELRERLTTGESGLGARMLDNLEARSPIVQSIQNAEILSEFFGKQNNDTRRAYKDAIKLVNTEIGELGLESPTLGSGFASSSTSSATHAPARAEKNLGKGKESTKGKQTGKIETQSELFHAVQGREVNLSMLSWLSEREIKGVMNHDLLKTNLSILSHGQFVQAQWQAENQNQYSVRFNAGVGIFSKTVATVQYNEDLSYVSVRPTNNSFAIDDTMKALLKLFLTPEKPVNITELLLGKSADIEDLDPEGLAQLSVSDITTDTDSLATQPSNTRYILPDPMGVKHSNTRTTPTLSEHELGEIKTIMSRKVQMPTWGRVVDTAYSLSSLVCSIAVLMTGSTLPITPVCVYTVGEWQVDPGWQTEDYLFTSLEGRQRMNLFQLHHRILRRAGERVIVIVEGNEYEIIGFGGCTCCGGILVRDLETKNGFMKIDPEYNVAQIRRLKINRNAPDEVKAHMRIIAKYFDAEETANFKFKQQTIPLQNPWIFAADVTERCFNYQLTGLKAALGQEVSNSGSCNLRESNGAYVHTNKLHREQLKSMLLDIGGTLLDDKSSPTADDRYLCSNATIDGHECKVLKVGNRIVAHAEPRVILTKYTRSKTIRVNSGQMFSRSNSNIFRPLEPNIGQEKIVTFEEEIETTVDLEEVNRPNLTIVDKATLVATSCAMLLLSYPYRYVISKDQTKAAKKLIGAEPQISGLNWTLDKHIEEDTQVAKEGAAKKAKILAAIKLKLGKPISLNSTQRELLEDEGYDAQMKVLMHSEDLLGREAPTLRTQMAIRAIRSKHDQGIRVFTATPLSCALESLENAIVGTTIGLQQQYSYQEQMITVHKLNRKMIDLEVKTCQYSDTGLVTKPTDEQLKAHKVMLIAMGQYFSQMDLRNEIARGSEVYIEVPNQRPALQSSDEVYTTLVEEGNITPLAMPNWIMALRDGKLHDFEMQVVSKIHNGVLCEIRLSSATLFTDAIHKLSNTKVVVHVPKLEMMINQILGKSNLMQYEELEVPLTLWRNATLRTLLPYSFKENLEYIRIQLHVSVYTRRNKRAKYDITTLQACKIAAAAELYALQRDQKYSAGIELWKQEYGTTVNMRTPMVENIQYLKDMLKGWIAEVVKFTPLNRNWTELFALGEHTLEHAGMGNIAMIFKSLKTHSANWQVNCDTSRSFPNIYIKELDERRRAVKGLHQEREYRMTKFTGHVAPVKRKPAKGGILGGGRWLVVYSGTRGDQEALDACARIITASGGIVTTMGDNSKHYRNGEYDINVKLTDAYQALQDVQAGNWTKACKDYMTNNLQILDTHFIWFSGEKGNVLALNHEVTLSIFKIEYNTVGLQTIPTQPIWQDPHINIARAITRPHETIIVREWPFEEGCGIRQSTEWEVDNGKHQPRLILALKGWEQNEEAITHATNFVEAAKRYKIHIIDCTSWGLKDGEGVEHQEFDKVKLTTNDFVLCMSGRGTLIKTLQCAAIPLCIGNGMDKAANRIKLELAGLTLNAQQLQNVTDRENRPTAYHTALTMGPMISRRLWAAHTMRWISRHLSLDINLPTVEFAPTEEPGSHYNVGTRLVRREGMSFITMDGLNKYDPEQAEGWEPIEDPFFNWKKADHEHEKNQAEALEERTPDSKDQEKPDQSDLGVQQRQLKDTSLDKHESTHGHDGESKAPNDNSWANSGFSGSMFKDADPKGKPCPQCKTVETKTRHICRCKCPNPELKEMWAKPHLTSCRYHAAKFTVPGANSQSSALVLKPMEAVKGGPTSRKPAENIGQPTRDISGGWMVNQATAKGPIKVLYNPTVDAPTRCVALTLEKMAGHNMKTFNQWRDQIFHRKLHTIDELIFYALVLKINLTVLDGQGRGTTIGVKSDKGFTVQIKMSDESVSHVCIVSVDTAQSPLPRQMTMSSKIEMHDTLLCMTYRGKTSNAVMVGTAMIEKFAAWMNDVTPTGHEEVVLKGHQDAELKAAKEFFSGLRAEIGIRLQFKGLYSLSDRTLRSPTCNGELVIRPNGYSSTERLTATAGRLYGVLTAKGDIELAVAVDSINPTGVSLITGSRGTYGLMGIDLHMQLFELPHHRKLQVQEAEKTWINHSSMRGFCSANAIDNTLPIRSPFGKTLLIMDFNLRTHHHNVEHEFLANFDTDNMIFFDHTGEQLDKDRNATLAQHFKEEVALVAAIKPTNSIHINFQRGRLTLQRTELDPMKAGDIRTIEPVLTNEAINRTKLRNMGLEDLSQLLKCEPNRI